MNQEPTKPYVYQPYGMEENDNWKDKTIYGVAGLENATIKGISRDLAEMIVQWLEENREVE